MATVRLRRNTPSRVAIARVDTMTREHYLHRAVERPRTRTKRNFQPLQRERTLVVPGRPNTGALASAAWLAARDLFPTEARWSVTVALWPLPDGSHEPTRFTLEIFAEEWGFSLRRADKLSWIRITDMPFVHSRDDFALLRRTPRLDMVSDLLLSIEDEHSITFDRSQPRVTSSFGHEDTIARWARSL